jgi:hypothetical protein
MQRREGSSMSVSDQLARIEQDTATLREAIERIKASPDLCSRFLGACARLRALEKEVRHASLGFLEAGQSVRGAELNEGRLLSTVGAEAILEVVADLDLKQRLAKLESFVHAACPVRESVYSVLCRKLAIKPRANHVERRRGLPFLIFKGASGEPWRRGDEGS